MTTEQADRRTATTSTRPEAPAKAASNAPTGHPTQPRLTLPEGFGASIVARWTPRGR